MEKRRGLGQVIILNGAPRSGKSTIATAIQEASDEFWNSNNTQRHERLVSARLPVTSQRPG